jgi:DinB family protein
MIPLAPKMVDIHRVLDQLVGGPALVRQVIYAMPEDLRKRRPTPGVWSAHEHAVHLAMVDPIMIERLDYMLSDPSPYIKSYEPSRDEEEGSLLKLDLDAEMFRYELQRETFLERLRKLKREHWRISAEHEEYSHYGIYIMARHIGFHDLHHAYKIEERLLRKSWD